MEELRLKKSFVNEKFRRDDSEQKQNSYYQRMNTAEIRVMKRRKLKSKVRKIVSK